MNIFRRLVDWAKEWGKTWTVEEDYGPEGLHLGTPFGLLAIPPDFRYNRFSAVWNTPYKEMWKASAGHDYLCDQIEKHGCVRDFDGVVIIHSRAEADLAFLYLMIRAIEAIYLGMLHGALREKDLKKREKLVRRVATIARRLLWRAAIYHLGVRMYSRTIASHGPKKKRQI